MFSLQPKPYTWYLISALILVLVAIITFISQAAPATLLYVGDYLNPNDSQIYKVVYFPQEDRVIMSTYPFNQLKLQSGVERRAIANNQRIIVPESNFYPLSYQTDALGKIGYLTGYIKDTYNNSLDNRLYKINLATRKVNLVWKSHLQEYQTQRIHSVTGEIMEFSNRGTVEIISTSPQHIMMAISPCVECSPGLLARPIVLIINTQTERELIINDADLGDTKLPKLDRSSQTMSYYPTQIVRSQCSDKENPWCYTDCKNTATCNKLYIDEIETLPIPTSVPLP